MNKLLTIGFNEEREFTDFSIRDLRGAVGLYFIYLTDTRISYPLSESRLIYIGMSESRQNSIGNRLRDHRIGASGNKGLTNFINNRSTRFTYHALEFLQVIGIEYVLYLEYLFLTEFTKSLGSHPICNNQSGITPILVSPHHPLVVDWSFFK